MIPGCHHGRVSRRHRRSRPLIPVTGTARPARRPPPAIPRPTACQRPRSRAHTAPAWSTRQHRRTAATRRASTPRNWREERVSKIPRRPVPAEPGSLANVLEHSPDVPRTQWCTGGREYPAVSCQSHGQRMLPRPWMPFPYQGGGCTGGSRLWLPGLRLAFQKGHLAAKTWWAQLGSNQRPLACKAEIRQGLRPALRVGSCT